MWNSSGEKGILQGITVCLVSAVSETMLNKIQIAGELTLTSYHQLIISADIVAVIAQPSYVDIIDKVLLIIIPPRSLKQRKRGV